MRGVRKFFVGVHDILLNVFLSRTYSFVYIVEGANWSTDWDGKNTVDTLKKQGIRGRISSTHIGLRNTIIHFGSVGTFITQKGIKKVHSSNTIILTWFHVAPEDTRVQYIPLLNSKTSLVHTSCLLTKEKLMAYGLEEAHIKTIPLGVDRALFFPIADERRKSLRKELGCPEQALLVGSFQKDGDGWGEGMMPKHIKGPDIFCDVIERLAHTYPVHVVLTGPARGYVKERLRSAGVSYTHTYLPDFFDIVRYYQILDLYLICSREEGGPKALLESMACGIPLVSTFVGMAPEILVDGKNGYLVRDFDADIIYQKAEAVFTNPQLAVQFSQEGIRTINAYDINTIGQMYWQILYRPFVIQ